MMDKSEVVLYQLNNSTAQFEVWIKDETVWLNRNQIAQLFKRDIKTIGKHIANALREELSSISVVANFATTAADGKIYQVAHYNLDMIISIGYRVKSVQGIQFRIWATQVLKKYLLKGYALHQRVDRIERKLVEHDIAIEQFVNTALPPAEGIFFDGQLFDAYQFASNIIKSAAKSVILIDNYIDENVLIMLSKRNKNAVAIIYTANISKQLRLDLEKFNAQYPAIEIKTFTKSHDRFLIIDDDTVYHIGASLKDLGKKWFAFSKINIDAVEMIKRLRN